MGDICLLLNFVCESVNIKVCQYQVMIENGLFEETNEQHIFSKVFYN